MTAENFISKYTDIETRCFIKKQRTVLLDRLIDEALQQNSLSTFDEISFVVNQLLDKKIKIRQSLFSRLIYPVLSKQVDSDNVDAIKLMIKLLYLLSGFQELTGNHKYSYDQLIERGLYLQPNDKGLLENRELTLRSYLNMTLHEIPTGVLYETNGATIQECDELLKVLTYYKSICDMLHVDHTDLINEARFYYEAYKEYLSVYQRFNGFKDYLSRTTIKQQPTTGLLP
ncbi:hypothetical protein FC093_23345 [Ilyomonas limi]|uniref:Uncharacterized protein n=1 Tax=Ilyomonas limi TaxID=2575867 RepID=A0A4U3KPL4_9BACT|nr:hypothetical protein [Ilyomonas limi]TKK64092.1 hypothetical protein FC093_23345 [Ilyomonas limi]